MNNLEFELIFDELVDNMLESGLSLDAIEERLLEQVYRAVEERR